MAEIHGSFLMPVELTEGWVGLVVGWGGVGAGKNPIAAMTPTQWPMLHWYATKTVVAILGPHHLIGTLHWCHCSSHDFGRLVKYPSGKQKVNI